MDHDQERGDLCHPDIPGRLQEFREDLVDDRVPEHRDSHADSSHELSLEPTWPHNGCNHIRAKQKLLEKEACKSSWSQIGSLKSLTLTIPWNLASLVKIFPGIIVRGHHTSETNGIVERAVRRV